jgi:hypothetical protein
LAGVEQADLLLEEEQQTEAQSIIDDSDGRTAVPRVGDWRETPGDHA